MLNWANQYNICCFLDNNHYASSYNRYEAIMAAGAINTLSCNAGTAFSQLQQFYDTHSDWLFGHLGYDLKNEVFAGMHSGNADGLHMPDLFFFQPEIVLLLKGEELSIGGWNMDQQAAANIFAAIRHTTISVVNKAVSNTDITAHIDREQYIQAVRDLQEHIHRGDCYEVNFCRENFIRDTTAEPLELFRRLNQLSPAPFSAYYHFEDKFLVCSSPERFLQKKGPLLISQPIKGTIKRDGDVLKDKERRLELLHNNKERAENVMVVDLVRNDLSHTALQGTVRVAELFGIYSFAQVHHMISTVTAMPDPNLPLTEPVKQAFPMGSMTGAPKKRVLELIEQYEQSKRGLYSGAVGYITPDGDFDFNVVIRSILYNAGNRYLSFQTGSAITYYASAAQEWEECLLKAAAMKKIITA
ncbi:anthranilate synthase component I family protein [Chitinophaga sancti]|uniref:Anthranilate synthase component I family protein n=1 Tax=Chitinophaga sancti TaxID=1004 RepID=A0A1K1PDQ0_9BACT|nr:anthranilate synthase component I family protein [Chitinophaga sancti]WQD65813.1 anthranilate synthase component I family protein [Chitinophaga sancti]WQG88565.1 anthranilate synthase component I family protein [Chitinophaga sancti]SFW45896.1 para-aminobenzoate synthetase component 1 [Chitinophaga sancti]